MNGAVVTLLLSSILYKHRATFTHLTILLTLYVAYIYCLPLPTNCMVQWRRETWVVGRGSFLQLPFATLEAICDGKTSTSGLLFYEFITFQYLYFPFLYLIGAVFIFYFNYILKFCLLFYYYRHPSCLMPINIFNISNTLVARKVLRFIFCSTIHISRLYCIVFSSFLIRFF